ncbi:hypothetical protein K6119_13470 [Paracrocinitomix mangrovi]|uniref:hypothetical protein n=1 Tax=Paracrocinitomix mangrovi TaxID=2862509 RepID=UPI001C8DB0B7|nr:hypothetical protein [Paracrocinitomix mangrovi]UKN00741.1 hypothetical protein K6119_13470 [Paracrocinitomix mangrovi]
MKIRQQLLDKKLYQLLMITLITACQQKDTKEPTLFTHDTLYVVDNPLPILFDEYKRLELSFCDTFHYEITDLYPNQNELTNINNDTLYLDNAIKDAGFTTDGASWGNWANGPRILSMELDTDSCHCEVYKKYWCLNDSCTQLKITEEIKCN